MRASLPRRLRSQTAVIRYGIEVAVTASRRHDRLAARAEIGAAPDDLVIGTVANLRATKGYPDLLAAARQVIATEPRARFVAVGQGPLADDLRATSTKLDSLLDKASNGRGTTGRLMNDAGLYDDMRKSLQRIDSLMADFQKNPRKYIKLSIF